jgi:hypothetical protein
VTLGLADLLFVGGTPVLVGALGITRTTSTVTNATRNQVGSQV